MKRIVFLPLLLIAAVMIGCIRPYPIYDLVPSGDYTTRWLFGCEYVISEENDIVTSFAYVNSEKDLLVFDLEVINRSNANILVSPEVLNYRPLSGKNISDTLIVMAIDPEIQLKKIDKVISRKRADLSNQAITNFVVETADLIGDIASSDEMTIEEKQLDAQEDLERQVEADREETRTWNQINDLSAQRNYWATEVLRKTTLKPGDAIHGRIYFPSNRDVEKLQIIIPIASSEFRVNFDQSRF